jgi:hypothetical protein
LGSEVSARGFVWEVEEEDEEEVEPEEEGSPNRGISCLPRWVRPVIRSVPDAKVGTISTSE